MSERDRQALKIYGKTFDLLCIDRKIIIDQLIAASK